VPRRSLLPLALALVACASAAGCGARSSVLEPEQDAGAGGGEALVPAGGCADGSRWTAVAPGELPTSTLGVACALTCREVGAARMTLFCDGYPGALSDCFCVVGVPGRPGGIFDYDTCWVGGMSLFSDNDGAACGRRLAADLGGTITRCRSEARAPECRRLAAE
jgi:hypothetical protein